MHHTTTQLHIPHRLAALVLCLLLAISLLPATASAASGSTGELSWSLSAGTLTVSGSGPMPEYTDANMPPWSDIAGAVSRIVVKEGVTSVGSLAFYDCTNATSVLLASGVTSIGDRAFKNCRSLSYLKLPAGLTSIGEAAFESCEALQGITLPEGLLTLGDYAFDRCTGLTGIVIPSTVNSLGMVAFAHCTGLTQATILCPITKLPDWFFYGCTSLLSVSVPETVTETGENAFHDCASLTTVYYAGAAPEVIADAVPGTPPIIDPDPGNMGSTSFGSSYDTTTDTGTTTTVTGSENATITQKVETAYDYTVNGAPATLDQVLSTQETDTVEVDSSTSVSIDATVENAQGWDEVVQTVDKAVDRRPENAPVDVNIQLNDSKVEGTDLSKLAGKDVTLSVSTDTGCTWVVDAAGQSKKDFDDKTYDLDITVTKLEENKTDIQGETVYQVEFASDAAFSTTVGINLKRDDAEQYATLYEKQSGSMNELQTVMVDENGRAWFSMDQVRKGTDYYVGINVPGANRENAVIPDSLHEKYGVNYTLTDASGKQYSVGDRTSRWGITGGQFALYVAIAVGAVILLVALIMLTLNKMNRSKAKYAAMAEADEAERKRKRAGLTEEASIDEDALRLQLLQEFLKEIHQDEEQPK